MSCQNYLGKKGYSAQKINISDTDAGNILLIITSTLSLPLSMVVTLRMGTIGQAVS